MLATVQNLLKGWGDGGKHLAKNVVALHAFKLNKYLTCFQPLGDQVKALPLFKKFLITIIIENQQKREAGYF